MNSVAASASAAAAAAAALRDKCSSRSDLFQNVKSKYFAFLYFSTLFGSLGIDINQKLGCDSFQKEFMIF